MPTALVPLEPICYEIRRALAELHRIAADTLKDATGYEPHSIRLRAVAHTLHRNAATIDAISKASQEIERLNYQHSINFRST